MPTDRREAGAFPGHWAAGPPARDLEEHGQALHLTTALRTAITSPGGCGLLAQGLGAADAANVTVSGTSAGLCNEKGFNFIKGAGNSGW